MFKTNKIYCGDSLGVLKRIESNSVELVLTSPPYFQQRDYLGLGYGNECDEQEYLDNLLCIFSECHRVVSLNGHIVFNLGDKYFNGCLSLLPYKFALEVLEKFDVQLINQITWVKSNPVPRQDDKKLIQATEPFFIFAKSKNHYFNKEDYLKENTSQRKKSPNTKIGLGYFKQIENSSLSSKEKEDATIELKKSINEVKEGEIESFRMKIRGIHALPYGGQKGGRMNDINKKGFTIIRIYGNSIKRDVIECPVETIKRGKHPAVYPKYICKQIIKLLTKEGDVVLDPFVGSGTTCLVAKELNRKYIGIDIEQEYVAYANERLES